MTGIRIEIENEKTASLAIANPANDFGLFSASQDDYLLGFKSAPLFEINHSPVEERWFFDVFPDGRRIPRADVAFNEQVGRWLRDSCCTDFSVFNFLPDGEYRLVKTTRKALAPDKILYGNEWADSCPNILTFNGIKDKDAMLDGTAAGLIGRQKYYPLIIGGDIDRAPVMNQPLLCVILPDYGIVWDGATGFIFLSFGSDQSAGRDQSGMTEEKRIMLILPFGDNLIVDAMNRKRFFDKRIIDDFIKVI
jgi:hypothetical protein